MRACLHADLSMNVREYMVKGDSKNAYMQVYS